LGSITIFIVGRPIGYDTWPGALIFIYATVKIFVEDYSNNRMTNASNTFQQ
jgi:hypothetical protein